MDRRVGWAGGWKQGPGGDVEGLAVEEHDALQIDADLLERAVELRGFCYWGAAETRLGAALAEVAFAAFEAAGSASAGGVAFAA
jgi:hypothetical protein